MTLDTRKMHRQLKARRRALLQNYGEEDLHKLRVGLRRIRSLLKRRPGGKARRLRRELGILAGTTNPARDWDTLVMHAERLLAQEQFNCLQPSLAQRQAVAHEQVLAMLRSKQWSRAVKAWKKYASRADLGSKKPSDREGNIMRLLHHADKARRRALERGDDRSWHKLRIAIKELRYRLQALPKRSRTPRNDAMLAYCKRLQEDLGTWHDAVVHQQLLHDLRETQTGREQAAATDMLSRLIEQERQGSLDRMRLALDPSVGLEFG